MKSTPFPAAPLFKKVCEDGLSVVRPLLKSAEAEDKWGWNYGTAQIPSYWAYGRLRTLLTFNIAAELHPESVLECAAGDGALCASLEQATGCRATANDLRRENLESSLAHFTNRDHIELLPGNILDLNPETVGSFDLVTACELIEHVADAVGLLRQLKRFTNPNGHILLTTPNGAYFRNKLPTYSQVKDFKALESRQFKPDADGHLYLITPAEMRQIASQAGLKIRYLVVWGSPFISGESGIRFLHSLALPFYRLEVACQHLGTSVRSRLCNSMAVVLTSTP